MDGHHIARVLELVEKYYRPVGEKYGKGRQFGCLALRGPVSAPMPLTATVPFGVIPADSGCYKFAAEKVNRLAKHGDDWSSFQSRDPDNKRWGGAIRLADESTTIGFMAWSSYPEPVDEAFMAAVAVKAELMTVSRAEQVLMPSQNPFFMPITDLMNK